MSAPSLAHIFLLLTTEAESRGMSLQDLRGFLERWISASSPKERRQVASDLNEWVDAHPHRRKVLSAHKEAE